MGLPEDWKKYEADAKKILGPKGQIETRKMPHVFKAFQELKPATASLTATRDVLDAKITTLRQIVAKLKMALDDARNDAIDADYDLNPKDPADKKKIDATTALLNKFFSGWGGSVDEYQGALTALDRHLEHLHKFKIEKI